MATNAGDNDFKMKFDMLIKNPDEMDRIARQAAKMAAPPNLDGMDIGQLGGGPGPEMDIGVSGPAEAASLMAGAGGAPAQQSPFGGGALVGGGAAPGFTPSPAPKLPSAGHQGMMKVGAGVKPAAEQRTVEQDRLIEALAAIINRGGA